MRSTEVGALASVFKKSATQLKQKQKLLKYKSSIQIATFNIRTQTLPEPILSAIDHNVDTVCIQKHRYLHSEDMKYYDTGNGWTFVSASAWKNSVNTVIEALGMLMGPRALKSLNSIEKIQPRMTVAMFNVQQSSPFTALPMLVTKKTLSPSKTSYLPIFVASQNNILTIGGGMNAQIGKNVNKKFSLHNSSNRNREYLIDFTLKNRLICLNTKFQKRNGKLWTYSYANNTKAQITNNKSL